MSFSIVAGLTVLLTLSQIFSNQGQFVREFQPGQQAEVLQALRNSCQVMMQDENIQALNVPVLVQVMRNGLERYERLRQQAVEDYCEQLREEALENSDGTDEVPVCDESEALREFEAEHAEQFAGLSRELQIFEGFDIRDALQLYEALCVPPYEASLPETIRLEEVIEHYNRLAAEALDVDLSIFENFRLPESSPIYASDGQTLVGEIFGHENRRTWVPLEQIPPLLAQAFVSAEDKNFRTHVGVDRGGILRGLVKYMQSQKIEGGSTITQQVIKNIVTGSEVSLDRKIKEMILAVRLERHLQNKDKILEIYLNLIFLGRNSWGVEMATRNFFGAGKSVADLDLGQMAFLAGITHSPNRYEPDRGTQNIRERQSYVLGRLLEDGHITEEQKQAALQSELGFIERQPIRTSYFHHAVRDDVRKRVRDDVRSGGGVTYFSTQIPEIQKITEASLQEQLAVYEMGRNAVEWQGPLRSLAENREEPPEVLPLSEQEWSASLRSLKAQYQDIHWNLAVVLEINSDGIQIGVNTEEGPQISRLAIADHGNSWAARVRPEIKVGDVVFVAPYRERFALRVPPQVQGAAVVMEAQTGKVVALSGGFSVHFTEYNRAINALRQPGSTMKPFTYLAALQSGFQPDTLVPNEPIYFDKVERRCNAWRPRNYSNSGPSQMTLRRGLETSSNRVTARLLKAVYPTDPVVALNRVRDITADFGMYEEPYDCFPFILGSDETSLVRLASAYAVVANGGTYVEPHFLDETRNAPILTQAPERRAVTTVDQVSLYQLRHILTGVVENGTAQRLKSLNGPNGSLYLGGKTGTSSGYNDAWFVGFSDKLVVAVWVGYDQRRSLGTTGGSLAAPVAKEIFTQALELYPPVDLLARPPLGIDLIPVGNHIESFRVSAADTRYWVLNGYSPLLPRAPAPIEVSPLPPLDITPQAPVEPAPPAPSPSGPSLPVPAPLPDPNGSYDPWTQPPPAYVPRTREERMNDIPLMPRTSGN